MISRILRTLRLALKGAWQCKIYLLDSCRSVAAKGFFFLQKKVKRAEKMFYILLLLSDETVRKGLNRSLLQTRRT